MKLSIAEVQLTVVGNNQCALHWVSLHDVDNERNKPNLEESIVEFSVSVSGSAVLDSTKHSTIAQNWLLSQSCQTLAAKLIAS